MFGNILKIEPSTLLKPAKKHGGRNAISFNAAGNYAVLKQETGPSKGRTSRTVTLTSHALFFTSLYISKKV
jgi:hypothetical protein